jgi:hypothetical protein
MPILTISHFDLNSIRSIFRSEFTYMPVVMNCTWAMQQDVFFSRPYRPLIFLFGSFHLVVMPQLLHDTPLSLSLFYRPTQEQCLALLSLETTPSRHQHILR